MSWLDYFRLGKASSAAQAKERLQVIIAHSRSEQGAPEYLPRLQREILAVIKKYVQVEQDDVKVNLEREGNCEVLELNITLPQK